MGYARQTRRITTIRRKSNGSKTKVRRKRRK